MKASFFNEAGMLNLDELVAQSDSFQKIMEDGVVTDDEVKQQVDRVVAHLHQLETICNAEQIAQMRTAFAELGVLFAVYHYKELQDIKQ
jgi:hypothetical protein